jgi:hypothetical protein
MMMTPSSPTTSSSFDVSLMPVAIHKRTFYPFSVHLSALTGRWVATITNAGVGEPPSESKRTIQVSFHTEREARKFAKAFSPPKMMTPPFLECLVCFTTFNHRNRPYHCRNCGASICDKCSTRWGCRMIPKTYFLNAQAMTVRVCKSCNWLSNAFCMALLQGNYEDAITVFETGNVNLRSTFAGINGEAM